uniref:Uncharacterized protein n=1 Tax=Zea mays TaxID=4577 RepID=A0A804QWG3_MAIZE
MPVRGAFFSFRTHLSIFRCLVDHRLNDPPPEPPNPKIVSSIQPFLRRQLHLSRCTRSMASWWQRCRR